VLDVRGHRPVGDHQRLTDLAVREATRDQGRYLPLAGTQRRPIGIRRGLFRMASQHETARATRVPKSVPFFNPVARLLLVAGVPMGPNALVTVHGRRSGMPRTTPLTIVAAKGRRWLLAPFGETDWVRNLRAAGRATIRLRRRTER
jgi:hypothetical protein